MNGARTKYPASVGKEKVLFAANDFCGRLYGLNICGDAAEPGYGLSQIECHDAPSAGSVSCLSQKGDFYLYNSGTLYRSTRLRGYFFSVAEEFKDQPCFASCTEGADDFVIVIGGEKSLCASSSSIVSESFPALKCAAVHYFRLFGVDPDDALTIRWSRAGDVRDWEEELYGAGYIRLSAEFGNVLALIPYDDKLIAVRQYGLTILRIYGDTEDFRVQFADTACEEVVEGTACVCADKLYFYTSGGLRCFDGNDIECPEIECLEGFGDATAAAALGCTYFVCGSLNGSPAVACIDCEEERASYIMTEVGCICSGAGRVALFNGNLYELKTLSFGSWDSGETDFGVGCQKYLSKLHICGSIQKVTVQWNGRERTFEGDLKVIKVGALARTFRIVIECSQLVEVRAEYIARG